MHCVTELGSFRCAVQSLNNEYLALTMSAVASHKQVQHPTMVSFVGFTAGRRLFKENEIFLPDKGHIELT